MPFIMSDATVMGAKSVEAGDMVIMATMPTGTTVERPCGRGSPPRRSSPRPISGAATQPRGKGRRFATFGTPSVRTTVGSVVPFRCEDLRNRMISESSRMNHIGDFTVYLRVTRYFQVK